MEKNHIAIENFSLKIKENQILKNISLAFPDKKISVIFGPSGCGKSTLLKSMNRLIDLIPDVRHSGRILVDNEDILAPETEVTHIRKKMGLLLQKPSVLPMSIYDNVAFGPRLHGIKNRKKLDEIVEQYLLKASLFDEVKNRLKEPAASLSLGQQQRLCLARGLAVEPEIILGDEPTSALDPLSTQKIEQTFLELKKDYTIILVTHILRQAKRLADFVAFIYLGEIIEAGPATQVLSDPQNKMTREYITGIIS